MRENNNNGVRTIQPSALTGRFVMQINERKVAILKIICRTFPKPLLYAYITKTLKSNPEEN